MQRDHWIHRIAPLLLEDPDDVRFGIERNLLLATGDGRAPDVAEHQRDQLAGDADTTRIDNAAAQAGNGPQLDPLASICKCGRFNIRDEAGQTRRHDLNLIDTSPAGRGNAKQMESAAQGSAHCVTSNRPLATPHMRYPTLLAAAMSASFAAAQEAWSTAHVAPTANTDVRMCWHQADARLIAITYRLDVDAMETWERVDGEWQQRHARTKVPLRQGYEVVYDSARDVVVLFGGHFQTGATNELWEWDGIDWQQRIPSSGAAPPARHSASVAYDAQRGVTVVYGGQAMSTNLDDHWEWNGATWTQVNVTASPGMRAGGRMTYDSARGVCVMFGGVTNWFQDDVWEYDGSQWQQFAPAFRPRPLRGASVAFDPASSRTVLYGGSDLGVANLDLWEWDGAQWLAVSAAATPGERVNAAIAYDQSAQRLVLHGGSYVTDTWSYERTAATWTRDAYEAPRLVSYAGQCFDGSQHTIYWTGLETKLWDHASRTWQSTSASATKPTSGLGRMAFDLARQEAVWFTQSPSDAAETWVWSPASQQWQQRTPLDTPLATYDASMAYDPATNRTVLFGGIRGTQASAETWLWDGVNWTQAFPATAPTPRYQASMAFDLAVGRLVLFGGTDGTASNDEVWEWDGTNWTQRVMAPGGPGPRRAAFMGSRSSDLLVASGADDASFYSDLWSLHGTTWAQLAGEAAPAGYPLQGTIDFSRGELTIFGTNGSVVFGGGYFTSGIWIYGPVRAEQVSIGSGCAGAGGTPSLVASTAPAFGQTMTLTAQGATPGQATAFLFGSSTGRVDLAASCRLFVPTPFAFPIVTTLANGDAALTVTVPMLPALAGLELASQALAFDTTAQGYALSNAVLLRLGW